MTQARKILKMYIFSKFPNFPKPLPRLPWVTFGMRTGLETLATMVYGLPSPYASPKCPRTTRERFGKVRKFWKNHHFSRFPAFP